MPPVPGRVTVGIPTYNRADFAERAARSVLNQTYADLELVVSDDPFPGDDSAARIEAFNANGKIVRVIRQPQRLGLQSNFDACLRLATGEYFLLLGDDDILHPEAIAELVRGFTHLPALATAADVGMVWCPCNVVNANKNVLWTTPAGPPLEPPERLLISLWNGRRGVRLSGILLRTCEAIEIGGFQQRFGDLCDIGLWGPIAVSHKYVHCIPQTLINYANHSRSATSTSDPNDWQLRAEGVLNLISKRARECGFDRAALQLEEHRSEFLAGVTLTVLIQKVGKPGWLRFWVAEFWRSRRFMLMPFVFSRALKDGWKLLRMREKK